MVLMVRWGTVVLKPVLLLEVDFVLDEIPFEAFFAMQTQHHIKFKRAPGSPFGFFLSFSSKDLASSISLPPSSFPSERGFKAIAPPPLPFTSSPFHLFFLSPSSSFKTHRSLPLSNPSQSFSHQITLYSNSPPSPPPYLNNSPTLHQHTITPNPTPLPYLPSLSLLDSAPAKFATYCPKASHPISKYLPTTSPRCLFSTTARI